MNSRKFKQALCHLMRRITSGFRVRAEEARPGMTG
jgi:hypothetical protein